MWNIWARSRPMCWKALAALSTLAIFSSAPASASPTSAGLDAVVAAEVPNGFSGVVLVAMDHAVILEKAYGAIDGVAPKADSRFWIASGGKQFVSAAILKCAQKGWLKLSDPISRFFPNAPTDKRAITIKQLLSHTSGFGQSYASEAANERTDAVRLMLAEPLIDRPGAKFHYSNSNYQLAAAIVEVASGEDYQDFAERELFRPVGLSHTGFSGWPGADKVARAREPLPERLKSQRWGEAGTFSSAGDLYRWYSALRAGRVLDKRSTDELFSPAAEIQEGNAALGWFTGKTVKGTARIFTRGNEDWGPNALIYAYPARDTVIVVLTHAGDANDDASWSRLIHEKLEAALNL